MTVRIKICGVKTLSALQVVAAAGAHYAGLVFVPSSRAYISKDNAAALLAHAPPELKTVALFVNAPDDMLAATLQTVPVHMIQLHGQESPARVAAIKAKFNLPVIKALPIATAEDLAAAADYVEVADHLLFDAKAPHGQNFGGRGVSFDWRVLSGFSCPKPWFLAGGLRPDSVAEAVRISGAKFVDVSSGVENPAGAKDPDKIQAFVRAATG